MESTAAVSMIGPMELLVVGLVLLLLLLPDRGDRRRLGDRASTSDRCSKPQPDAVPRLSLRGENTPVRAPSAVAH